MCCSLSTGRMLNELNAVNIPRYGNYVCCERMHIGTWASVRIARDKGVAPLSHHGM